MHNFTINIIFFFVAAGSLYKYEEGTNYKYKLEGTTITTVPGSQGDVSKISVTADVDISVQPQCSQFLKISNVHVTGPDGKVSFSLVFLLSNKNFSIIQLCFDWTY